MKYTVSIVIGDIEASSLEEAKKIAGELLYDLAGSNDGSEVLANAVPQLEARGEQ